MKKKTKLLVLMLSAQSILLAGCSLREPLGSWDPAECKRNVVLNAILMPIILQGSSGTTTDPGPPSVALQDLQLLMAMVQLEACETSK